jgi:DHA2 family multidrug resistance protein
VGQRTQFRSGRLSSFRNIPGRTRLDKGQEDDWSGSSFIVTFASISASSLVLFIPWALMKSNPIIDVRMLVSRQFGACFVVMSGVGGILIATTQMVPQLLQENYGYTATLSGLALSPGGIFTMVMMFAVGRLSFIQPKYLIAAGGAFAAYRMYCLTSLYGDTDFGYFVWSRVIVGVGLLPATA